MSEHKHTNLLINETSPYLLQHAHNPVNWHPWGEEAFAEAKRENKPILLSIGYSACHWCHVMEHESFENEEIAKLMNDNFVNIKVDREERPDLDQIYMNAVQMMTHHGGWPMTVFLTPEGTPYYGGTYFPPVDRHNMPGFPRVLIALAEAYRQRPDEIAETTASIQRELERLSATRESSELLTTGQLDSAYRGTVRNYDQINGGFGSAPKFPPAMALEFLLRTYYRTENPEALDIVSATCRKMAEGGIYDQLGGGFHRYSTDSKWLVPHFEKMLYDNALLSRLYLHHFQVSQDDQSRRVAAGVFDYVIREMTSPEGGFYSTQDADSESVEGKFFVWSTAEIEGLLGAEDAKLISDYYNVTAEGNFEGENILNVTRSLQEVASQNKIGTEELDAVLERSKQKLFEAREQRVKPSRDEKILTAWNGMMMASFAEAGAVLDREDYTSAARRNARFVLDSLRDNGLLLRTYKDGVAKLNGYLEDYACLAEGLLTLYEASGESEWLEECLAVTQKMVEEFWDDEAGGFFFTGKSHETLIVRSKDFFDNATPSGNSVAAEVLLRLGLLTDNEDYRRRALTVLRLVAEPMTRYPAGFGRALGALDFYLGTPKEIALVFAVKNEASDSLKREVWSRYLPNRVVGTSQGNDQRASQLIPFLANRSASPQPTAYVCEHYVCKNPVTQPSALAAQLAEKPTKQGHHSQASH
jgi:uncharacterized protein YyaL (SSP411 family)